MLFTSILISKTLNLSGLLTEDPQEHDPEDPQNSGTDKDHEELPVFALPGGVVTILAPSAPNTGGQPCC